MAANTSYAPIDGSENHREQHEAQSPASTPRLGEMDLGRMSFFDQSTARNSVRSAAASPSLGIRPDSPGFAQAFSSAQSYAPLSNDIRRPSTPGTPGTPGTLTDTLMGRSPSRPWLESKYSDRGSQRLSIASSHMLASSDYAGSQHHLTKYLDQSAIPMHDYEKAGESRATTPGGGHYIPVHSKSEKYTHLRDKLSSSSTSRKKWLIFAGIVFALVLIAIVIAIPLVVLHDKAHENDGQGPASVPGTGSDGQVLTSGSDGSVIRMENGTTFTYVNTFGGQWRSGLTDNGAQAQSYTPPMNESWDYAKNPILGVNLGGWLVIEPFIVPSTLR